MYNIFLVSHTMSLLLSWFRLTCRSSQRRKPAPVHNLLLAFLIGFLNPLGKELCILLLPPCSFECTASSQQYACAYAAGIPSHWILGALVMCFLSPFQWLPHNIVENVILLRQVEQLVDSADPLGTKMTGLRQSGPECPFHPFSLWERSGHSSLHQQCNCKWNCTFPLPFRGSDSRNGPGWAEGRHIQDTFVIVTTDSDNTSLPLLTKGISQDLHGHPLLIHFLVCTHCPLQWASGSWWLHCAHTLTLLERAALTQLPAIAEIQLITAHHSITELTSWKRPLRSSSPTYDPTPPYQLNHCSVPHLAFI